MAVLALQPVGGSARQTDGGLCRPSGPLVRVPGLQEASGLAVSRRNPGHLWTHNDSGAPVIYALDAKGGVAGTIRITGASLDDWEALAVAPCGSRSCVYIADIGDNDAKRTRVTLYRVPEPAANDASAAVDGVFHLTYPDGAHDAEALLVTPDGGVFIVTKGDTGPVALYRAPRNLRAGGTTQLERVGEPLTGARAPQDFRITDGSISRDGTWIVLRTTGRLVFYRAADFLKGNWRESRRVDVASLAEPQGEGVALGADHAVFLAGEGGGKRQPGTFVQFTCTPAP